MNILLHICCAPCACYPVEKLSADGHKVTGFWFNPNIHPYREYLARLEGLNLYVSKVALPIEIRDEYGLIPFLRATVEQESKPFRCIYCYNVRLRTTAEFAREHKFDAFTTTLLYSKYQLHDTIKEICESLSKEFGVAFYYEDFRLGWYRGIKISKELGLYRQKYCGCIFSEEEAIRTSAKK